MTDPIETNSRTGDTVEGFGASASPTAALVNRAQEGSALSGFDPLAGMADCGEVRKMAREAVARFLEADGGWTTGFVARIRAGDYDADDKIRLWELGFTDARQPPGEVHVQRIQRIAASTRAFFEQAYAHVTPDQLERIAACAADQMAFEIVGQTMAASEPSPKVQQDTHG